MLGTKNSRGYCLEMICADFLAGASLDNGNPQVLLETLVRFFKFLPHDDKQSFVNQFSKMRRCRELSSSKTRAATAVCSRI
jgi:hypothetical protein